MGLMDKFHPGYFGKVGMRHYHVKKGTTHTPTVNLDKLWSLVPEAERAAAQAGKGGKAYVIDVTQYGVYKVLGSGVLPNCPVVVKARYFTSLAEKKIKAVGGAVLTTA